MYFTRGSRRTFIKAGLKFVVAIALSYFQLKLAHSASKKELIKDVLAGRREIANAAWWGYETTSATRALQGAISSGAKKVLVPDMGHPWILEPIFLESNQEIEFEQGVTLLAQKNSFLGKKDCLIQAVNKENITLHGYDVALKMRRKDYKKRKYAESEWRHCLSLCGCRNINVCGLKFQESGGDGIYIGRGRGKNCRQYCEDINIKDVTCSKNYRQGISVISARNLVIEKCLLSNSEGVNPQAGIDYEPNKPDELLQECVLRDTIIEGNKKYGILFALGGLSDKSVPLSITVERCHIRKNGNDALHIRTLDAERVLSGRIKFIGNRIEGVCTIGKITNVELIL